MNTHRNTDDQVQGAASDSNFSESKCKKEAVSNEKYRSWVLRIWQEHANAPIRIQLKEVNGTSTLIFEDLPTFYDYVATQMQTPPNLY